MLAAIPDNVVGGLVLGFLLGVLAGPFIRSWLVWREWSSASRQADLHGSYEAELIADMLDRMEGDGWPPADEKADPGRPGSERQDA